MTTTPAVVPLHIVPADRLGALAASINKRLAHIEEERIEIGRELIEARKLVEEAGEVSWSEWCAANIKRSMRHVRRDMAIARSPDPQAALDKDRAAAREGMAKVRERTNVSPPPPMAEARGKLLKGDKADQYYISAGKELAKAKRIFEASRDHCADRDDAALNAIAKRAKTFLGKADHIRLTQIQKLFEDLTEANKKAFREWMELLRVEAFKPFVDGSFKVLSPEDQLAICERIAAEYPLPTEEDLTPKPPTKPQELV